MNKPFMPDYCPSNFWDLSISERVDWLLNLLASERCSAGWVMEKLQYMGIVPNGEIYMQGKEILMGAYEYYGKVPVEQLRKELIDIGVILG